MNNFFHPINCNFNVINDTIIVYIECCYDHWKELGGMEQPYLLFMWNLCSAHLHISHLTQ